MVAEPISALTVAAAELTGVSGSVVAELSGSYKTFPEAVKELVVNGHDADARKVHLTFGPNYQTLEIADDGAGMNPRQFTREYLRVGRSPDAKRWTPSGERIRIGGKGIGSLAPARYCGRLFVRTKSRLPMEEIIEATVPSIGTVTPAWLFPFLALSRDCWSLLADTFYQIVNADQTVTEWMPLLIQDVLDLPPGRLVRVSYRFRADRIWLEAEVDFRAMRESGERFNLERFSEWWKIRLAPARSEDYGRSGTTVTLQDLEPFVSADLQAPGTKKAKNVRSKSGIDRFVWTLSRLCPVPVTGSKGVLAAVFPPSLVEMLQADAPLHVFVTGPERPLTTDRITREVYRPALPIRGQDEVLCRVIRFNDPQTGLSVHGYVYASPTLIFPAELRGVSVRVQGVELGTPTLFGAEGLVSGPLHTALTGHITGELHLLDGVDARRDILPGREGLYPESPVYRLLRRTLVGTEANFDGILSELVTEILRRSEAAGSALTLIKKLELRSRALVDATVAVAKLMETDEAILERFETPITSDPQLLFYEQVDVRPEGRLKAFTVQYAALPKGTPFEIDYAHRILRLPDTAWYRIPVVNLGENYDVVYVHAPKERIFCEVDPNDSRIYINWGHRVRGAMGDEAYIKHCLAAVVSGIDQAALSRYVEIIANRST